jgi:hypothetical protein
MGLLDKVNAGAERAAMEAWKAFDKGKAKAAELQLEMRMDSAAKKLGYLVFDEHRGRSVDDRARDRLLDSLVSLDDDMAKLRAETASKVAARTGSAPVQPSDMQPAPGQAETSGSDAEQAESTGSGPDVADVAGSWPEAGPGEEGAEC